MRFSTLNQRLERLFWSHVNRNPFDYYFFIRDWQSEREKTKITLALEGDEIKGLMLIYADYVVQLRGNREAVEGLLKRVQIEKVSLQAPMDFEDLVLDKYDPGFRNELVLMSLKPSEENIQISTKPVKLDSEDIPSVVEVLGKADPGRWGNMDPEKQKESWADACLLGIYAEDQLVSIGITRFFDLGSNISAIATDEHHRNKGYATSIVSALVREIIREKSVPLIHVLRDNLPAVRAYSKVGFKPYRSYLFVEETKLKK